MNILMINNCCFRSFLPGPPVLRVLRYTQPWSILQLMSLGVSSGEPNRAFYNPMVRTHYKTHVCMYVCMYVCMHACMSVRATLRASVRACIVLENLSVHHRTHTFHTEEMTWCFSQYKLMWNIDQCLQYIVYDIGSLTGCLQPIPNISLVNGITMTKDQNIPDQWFKLPISYIYNSYII